MIMFFYSAALKTSHVLQRGVKGNPKSGVTELNPLTKYVFIYMNCDIFFVLTQAVFRVGDSSGSEEDDEEVVDAENVGLEDDQAELGGDLHEADPASSSTSSSDSDV